MEDKLNEVLSDYKSKVQKAQTLKELDEIFLALFGKAGELTILPKNFSKLSAEEKGKIGPLFNRVKIELENLINEKRNAIREENYSKLSAEPFDINAKTTIKDRKGHLHPLTQFEKQVADLFGKLGFQQFDGPQIDLDLNNFQLLNIPENHPSRDLQDTFYVDSKSMNQESKVVLRTHTSNSQIHIMKKFKLPIRMMAIGRVFRYENLDARHEHTFDQFEIVYVDKTVNMANLQYLSEYFLKNMLGNDTKARLSPGYYPFTEPSAHIFGTCVFCKGKGCKICGNTGELELAGAGMIHPKVLENCGIDSKVYSGIAWGVGPARMAMLKYNIQDLRLFNSGDLNFLTNLRKDSDESK